MTPRPTVLLFDIDGTLLTTGGVGRRALARAFAEHHGREDACSGFGFDGMTDGVIVRQGLEAIGVTADRPSIQRVLETYVQCLRAEIAAAPEDRYFLHEGMAEALERAGARAQTALGLGTGNIREGARLKLERLNAYHPFRFGGFGCDHDDRAELIRIGAERGAAHLGVPLGECRVVVIGDTPRDVAAAKAIGAESFGVTTGSYSEEQLRSCGADHVFPNLAARGALETLFGTGCDK